MHEEIWFFRHLTLVTRLGRMAVALCLLCVVGISFAAAEDEAEFFRRQVRPLLEDKCVSCHSHATRTMEGGLTLDSRSGWSTGGDRGPAVVPGKPQESLLLRAVTRADPDLQMPPDEPLTEAEVQILRDWIRRGAVDLREEPPAAPDTNWWSLRPLTAPAVPGDGHPIDAFVNDRLRSSGLSPLPAASAARLVRRATVDLHGLLPTPAAVEEFVADSRPDAVGRLVDGLLKSPRYGEHWARHWLDVIHFADSHGCEHDVKRPSAWRFRDYVIERLNDDVNWDRFVREQLAADVFFPDEPHLMAGLGFLAAGPLELSRAGTAPVTFDYLDRDDMVTQTMAAFASATVNCARCHQHKFDPITQEDYYALQAVFAGIGKGEISFDGSTDTLRRRQQLTAWEAAARARDADTLLAEPLADVVKSWLARQTSAPVAWQTLHPDVFVSVGGATLTRQSDGSLLASGTTPEQERYTVTATPELTRITAIRIEALPDASLPMQGPGRAGNGNFHLSEVGVQWFAAGEATPTVLTVSRTSADFDQAGWTSAQAIDGDTRSGWAIHPRIAQPHRIVLELATPLEISGPGHLAITLQHLYPPQHVMGRFRISITDAPAERARQPAADTTAALQTPAEQRTREQQAVLAAEAVAEYVRRQQAQLPARQTVYGVSSSWSHAKKLDQPQPPKTVHLLQRGDFQKPLYEVGPGSLSAIDVLPARFTDTHDDEALRRAALADWLVHPDNPLVWRSIVNRVWQFHFGQGLVDTPNDFGRMGGQPSHPDLLDWLAVWFRDEADGSLKQLHRLIMTSDAWQRSSGVGVVAMAEQRSRDADNRLLWRMNRQRLSADVFRDSVLQLSGRLDLTMGGPGVEQFAKSKGPQATPALDYAQFDWTTAAAGRRSIYRVVWRGIPDPFMEALDFPDLGLLAPRREFSASALQSLAVYNNDFVLHGSQWLADRVSADRRELSAQIDRAVALVWQREPSDAERLQLRTCAEQHGLAAVCRVLLNSNEFLFVD